MEYIVLEREFPEPLTSEDPPKMAASMLCLQLYRVEPVCSYLTSDGHRMICVFKAPDAEALRAVARTNGFPDGSVIWPSTLHTP